VSDRTSFVAIEVLLIDGNNLLHRLSGSADPAALRGLLPRLATAIPEEVGTVLMLDGHPAPGSGRATRVRRGFEVRQSGSRSADDALLDLVRATHAGSRAMTTVVTDDRSLTDRIRHLGAHTQRLAWLAGILGAGESTGSAIGSGARRDQRPSEPEAAEIERTPWRPGRGATRKRGNPRRTRRTTGA
jgi:rRNA-processing protein FCF1